MLKPHSEKKIRGFKVKVYHILVRKPSEAPHEIKMHKREKMDFFAFLKVLRAIFNSYQLIFRIYCTKFHVRYRTI